MYRTRTAIVQMLLRREMANNNRTGCSPWSGFIIGLWLFLLSSASALAQEPAPPVWSPPPKPHCDSFSMQHEPQMTLEEKACYFASQLFTPSAVFGAAFFGSIAMAEHTPAEWPQGAQGFGDQFGTRYTQGMVKSTGTFLVGALLHEDPRPKPPYDSACPDHLHVQHTEIWARFGSSLLRVVWTHNDQSCSDRIAFSRLAGSLASGFIQRVWLPPSQNTLGNAFLGSGSALGGYAAESVFTEFQGDLFGWLGKMFGTGKPKTLLAAPPPAAPAKN
jgi:hypothetical protein